MVSFCASGRHSNMPCNANIISKGLRCSIVPLISMCSKQLVMSAGVRIIMTLDSGLEGHWG